MGAIPSVDESGSPDSSPKEYFNGESLAPEPDTSGSPPRPLGQAGPPTRKAYQEKQNGLSAPRRATRAPLPADFHAAGDLLAVCQPAPFRYGRPSFPSSLRQPPPP